MGCWTDRRTNSIIIDMEATTKTEPLILWLLAVVTAIVLFVSLAHTPKVAAPTMQWQSDTSWVKGW